MRNHIYVILLAPLAALALVTIGTQQPQAVALSVQEEVAVAEFVAESQSYEVMSLQAAPSVARDSFAVEMHTVVMRPVPTGTAVGSWFGPRKAPCAGCSSDHKGIDYLAPRGSAVVSIAKGVVTQAGPLGSLGWTVTVQHVVDGAVVESIYGHMIEGSIVVGAGQTVALGDTLGLVGRTGAATANHLHFQMTVNGSVIDPRPWLDSHVNVDIWASLL